MAKRDELQRSILPIPDRFYHGDRAPHSTFTGVTSAVAAPQLHADIH